MRTIKEVLVTLPQTSLSVTWVFSYLTLLCLYQYFIFTFFFNKANDKTGGVNHCTVTE